MTRIIAHDIAVCTDCIRLLTTGDVWDSRGNNVWADVASAINDRWGNTEIVPRDCGEDGCSFSWQPCEGCGSMLGGDRYPAAYLERVS
jgi:hypothetical protein